jgi:hypothetical protein
VRHIRAAARDLNESDRVRIRGVYTAPRGLREATRFYFRNKGYARFSLRDVDADVWFGSLYCERDSGVFERLLGIAGEKIVVVEGTRGRGEDMEPAIFATGLRILDDPVGGGVGAEAEEAPKPAPPSTDVVTVPPGVSEVLAQPRDGTFRIKIIDASVGSTSVLSNVELDRPYRTFGATIILERE